MKNKLIRIAPILLIIVIAFLAIAALVSLGQALLGGGNKKTNQAEVVDTSTNNLLKNDAERSVKMTVRGPIVADEDFRSYTIEVSPTERRLVTYKGYLDGVIDDVRLENSTKSYDEFVYALNKANMMAGEAFTGEANDLRGICASGHIYDFAILIKGEVEKNLWTSTCSGSLGSLDASVKQLQNLFILQIPNNSEIVRDLGIGNTKS